jgi:beta-galactosidase
VTPRRAARIVVEGGRTLLSTRDGLEPAHFYVSPNPTAERVRRFAELGVRGVSFSATADFHPYSLAAPVLREDGTRDFSEFDARRRRILDANPDAILLPRVHLCSPPWWDRAHPDELCGFERTPGESGWEDGYLKPGAASFSSRAWRRFAADNLRAFVEHAVATDDAGSIVGLVVCGGRTEEWFHLGSVADVLCDDGPAATDAFRAWLKERPAAERARALAALGAASIDAARPPTFERRRGATSPSRFLDPVRDADVLAYEAFFSDEIATLLGELCGVVREASEGRLAAGAFYGYVVEMACHGSAMRHGGHLALGRVLADPRVDFLASPTSYVKRAPKEGASFAMTTTEDVLAAGKAYFHENDVRTFLLWDDAGYGRAGTAAESATQLRREARYANDHGLGLWWFDMIGGFYDHDALRAEAARGVEEARRVAGRPRTRPKLAFVVDEASLRTTDLWGDWYADVLPRQAAELHRAGGPVGMHLLDVFEPTSDYDLVVFPNFFRAEDEGLRRVRALLRGGRVRTALFIGPVAAAPTLRGDGPGPGAVLDLPFVVVRESTQVRARATAEAPSDADDPPEFGGARWWPWRLRPGVDAATPGVRVFARDPETGDAALVKVERSPCAVAWASGPVVPASLLRALL